MQLSGGCYCGEVRYKIDGEVTSRAQCFCRECQYVARGGPATLMVFKESAFQYTSGTPKSFSRSDIEAAVARDFCLACGTHLSSRTPPRAGYVVVKVGTLDDPSVLGLPDLAVYFGEAYSFDAAAEGIPVFERWPILG